jgi:small subunit ribosomal protein S16
MLVIRLARTGRNKYPTYRIVAAEHARAATGKFVAVLGHYNPHSKELVMNKEEIVRHIGNGAQPSNTVAKLLQREKVKLPDWVQVKTKTSKPKNAKPAEEPKAEAAPEAAPEAAAGADAPAAETEAPSEAEAPAETTPDDSAQA